MGRRYDLDLMILGRVRRNLAAGLKNADAVIELWRASQRTGGSACSTSAIMARRFAPGGDLLD
jgi:hypothetical protein